MPENVSVRIQAEGAEQAAQKVGLVQEALKGLDTALSPVAHQLGQMTGHLKNAVGGLDQAFEAFKKGQGGAEGLHAAFGALKEITVGIVNPVTSFIAVSGLLAETLNKVEQSAAATFKEMRELQAVSGQSAEATEVTVNAFKLAGVEGDRLNMAFFRLSMSIETGGKELEKLGIQMRTMTGELKEPGDLLLEIRDRIQEMGSTSERNAALMQAFGRAGRALAPAFALTREEFDKFVQTSKELSAINEEFMARQFAVNKANQEAELQWKRLGLALEPIAALIAEIWAAISGGIAAGVYNSLEGIGALFSSIANLLTGKWSQAWKDWTNTAVSSAQQAAKEAEKQAEEMERQAEKMVSPEKRLQMARVLTEGEAKYLEERLKFAEQERQATLKGEEQYTAALSKLETGRNEGSIEARRSLNTEMVAAANRLFAQEMDIAAKKAATGKIDRETEARLTHEHNMKLLQLNAEGRQLDIQDMQEKMQLRKQAMADELTAIKESESERLVAIRGARAKELDELAESNKTVTTQSRERADIEMRAARETLAAKVDAIEKEAAALQRMREEYPQNEQIQREVENRLMALHGQRVSAEEQANESILNSRKKLIEDLKTQAAEQAAIGGSLADMAVADLRKRGVKAFSKADIEHTMRDIAQTAREAGETFAGAGVLTEEQFERMRRFSQVQERAQRFGLPAEALGEQYFQRLQAGLAPTAAPISPESLGVDRITTGFQEGFDKVGSAADKMVSTIVEKINVGSSTIYTNIRDRIVDDLIRRLEAEAYRS